MSTTDPGASSTHRPSVGDRVAIETLRGNIRAGPVVETHTDASAETGFVDLVTVELAESVTQTVPAEDAQLP